MKKIELKSKYGFNKFALVDDEDFERVNLFEWRLLKIGYVSENSNKGVYLHRFILNAKKGQYVDHLNHNPLDNRKSNLRLCSNAVNNWNKKYKNNVGVSKARDNKNGHWRAYITINSKQKHLGVFKEKKDAYLAYNEAVKKYRDSFSFLNVTT